MNAYCGIDVACAKRKALPIVVAVREAGRFLTLPLRTEGPPPPRGMGNALAVDQASCASFAEDTLQYLQAVEQRFGVTITEVAIDAPREPANGSRRRAEQAMDDLRISCFATPSVRQWESIRKHIAEHLGQGGAVSRLPYANQLWMLVGFALFRRLATQYICIEVFPNAIVHAIAPGCRHKSTAGGFDRQLNAFARAANWDAGELATAAHGSRHDRLDATMSAWVASLPASDRIAHGDGALDTIWSARSVLAHVA